MGQASGYREALAIRLSFITKGSAADKQKPQEYLRPLLPRQGAPACYSE
jgi:hypothetical protein